MYVLLVSIAIRSLVQNATEFGMELAKLSKHFVETL